jgi:hypothetical protein
MAILNEHGLFWWHHEPIPDRLYAPAASIAGALTIADDGTIRLDLNGVMPREEARPFDVLVTQGKCPPSLLIQGILKGDNQRVLLSGLYANGGQFSSNGISFEQFDAEFCLLGHERFESTNGLPRAQGVVVGLSGFEDWLQLASLEYERTDNSVSISYQDVPNLTYALGDATLAIEYDIRGPYHGKYKRHDVHLKETARLLRTAASPMELAQVREEYSYLQDLFILLTDTDSSLEWPRVTLAGAGDARLALYFQRNKSRDQPPKWHECWTTFPELKPKFGEIYSLWLQKRREFGPAFYLYLGTRRGLPSLYVEHRFVNLIWGLESFHRRKYPTGTASERLAAKIQRILDSVSNRNDKRWLEKKLRLSAEPALESRLFDLLKAVPIALDVHALRTFCRECANLRNDISHFGGQREAGDYGQFMAQLDSRSDVLSHLYHLLLLHEIGAADAIAKGRGLRGRLPYVARHFMKEFGLLRADQAK